MFFQAEGASAPKEESYKSFSDVLKYFKESVDNVTSLKNAISGVVDMFAELGLEAEQLNKQFVGGRVRVQEITKAINEAAPGIRRLGGEFKDVRKTLADIAEGSRRQVVASSKDVQQLFAAGEVLDRSVSDIVSSFAKVGVSYDKVASNLENSISYVQGIGLNARVVMKDVLDNTEQLSRFNFQNGVQGFTKMAAQASMLRFDMKETFELAEGVLDPERAVEVASAFQRLGVSVGNLTDPFQLMNQSINDPSGLQNSLINMTKQFTYFDEQTQSFRINPQGILTLKEISSQTGISATELRKTALAAAEMDDKLKKINTTGFKLGVSEEDKMMVANIARMGEGGEYEVSIKDERGYEYQKKLSKLQEEDFKLLIEQQKKAPKTIEEIQLSQLNTAEKMLAEFQGLSQTLKSGFLGLPGMSKSIEDSFKFTREAAGSMNLATRDIGFLTEVKKLGDKIEAFKADTTIDEKTRKKRIEEVYEEAKSKFSGALDKFATATGSRIGKLAAQQDGVVGKFIETQVKLYNNLGINVGELKSAKGSAPGTMPSGKTKTSGVDLSMLTGSYNIPNSSDFSTAVAAANKSKSRVDIEFVNPNLNITIDVKGPVGLDEKSLNQVLASAQTQLKETLYKSVKEIAVSKGEVKV